MVISDHLTCLLRSLYAGQEITFRTEHGTMGSKLGKQYNKAVYCHPAYLTYMHSISFEMPGWMNHKLESRLLQETSATSVRYADDTTLMAEGEEELKSFLMKVKEESKEDSLKLNIKKMKIMASDPITSWQIEVENVKAVTDFLFFGL